MIDLLQEKKTFVPRPPESPEVIEARWRKKKFSIENLSNNIRKLKVNVTKDIQSDDEKDALTALIVAVMLQTAERIGNDDSASDGHLGVTGFTKSNVDVKGNTVSLDYTGKSGVHHEKCFTDERVAKYLKSAIKNSPSKYVFETSEGFRIKPDRVSRYLKPYGMKPKDIRGFLANTFTIDKLKKIEPEETDKKRKKQLNKILKDVAEKVGHGRPTLKKHYLVPELWDEWVERGKIIDLKDMGYLEKGGEADSDDVESKRVLLNKSVDEAESKLQEFIRPHKQASGLVPSEIKESGEYKELKRKFDVAFNELREFNSKNKPKRTGYSIKKESGGKIEPDKIKDAIRDVYYSRSARLEPEFEAESYKHEKKAAPNSFSIKEIGGTTSRKEKWKATDIIAYDEKGNIVGVLSISQTEPVGAFKITVREDARRKGWSKKLLDKAEESGFDMVGYMSANNFTPSGRWATIDWLSSKLSAKDLKEAQKEFLWLKSKGGELIEYLIVENDENHFRTRFDKSEAIADAESIFRKGNLSKIVVKDKNGNIYFEQRRKSFLEFYAEDGYLIF